MNKDQTEREVEKLRSDARYAYLNGRTKKAKELNKKADKLAAELRKSS